MRIVQDRSSSREQFEYREAKKYSGDALLKQMRWHDRVLWPSYERYVKKDVPDLWTLDFSEPEKEQDRSDKGARLAMKLSPIIDKYRREAKDPDYSGLKAYRDLMNGFVETAEEETGGPISFIYPYQGPDPIPGILRPTHAITMDDQDIRLAQEMATELEGKGFGAHLRDRFLANSKIQRPMDALDPKNYQSLNIDRSGPVVLILKGFGWGASHDDQLRKVAPVLEMVLEDILKPGDMVLALTPNRSWDNIEGLDMQEMAARHGFTPLISINEPLGTGPEADGLMVNKKALLYPSRFILLRKQSGARLSMTDTRQTTHDTRNADLRSTVFADFYGVHLPMFAMAMTPEGGIPILMPRGKIDFIGQQDVLAMQKKAAGARMATVPETPGSDLTDEQFVEEYRALLFVGQHLMAQAGEANVVIQQHINRRSMLEYGQINDIMADRGKFGENVYFEFFDRATGERIEELSNRDIPKDAKRVLLGHPVDFEIEQAIQNDWRFLPVEPPNSVDGQVGCLPLAAAFMAAVIVGRLKNIAGNDTAAQFFEHLTRVEDFGQEQYRYFVKPDASQEALYSRLSIKSIAFKAVDRFLNGARLALQALGQSA